MPAISSAQATATTSSSGRPPGREHGSGDFLIVGIGASAGGLDACSKLMDVLEADCGMAFILVQHLDPTHESMLAELLAEHTKMTVQDAASGMELEPNHVYVITPGTYLSVAGGRLQVSKPSTRQGARLPFDVLLQSMAQEYGARAACVVLSGTGADGSAGLRAVKEKGGLVIAQNIEEAGFGGMPGSAIQTGAVDLVLRIADIPRALERYDRRMTLAGNRAAAAAGEAADDATPEWLPSIIELLRTRTVHDFTLYKTGTLQRRIERRMAMAAIDTDDANGYLALLQRDASELDRLAKDLLINVTSFFRDPEVFAELAETIIPPMIRGRAANQPLRVWVAGCSTGGETYSLVMLFREEIEKQNSRVKLQVFASDADPDAVASAREGLYPETIEADVSHERLARFFVREDGFYRVVPELRAAVVFTVQDVLADPPFSRLDLVSCRNLLIYLRPEAQARVISLFHFALRPGGMLVLGSAETPGNVEGRFEIVSKSARIYRQIGHSRPTEFTFPMSAGGTLRARVATGRDRAPSFPDVAEMCRRLLLQTYAPAAILINQRHECLFLFGATDRYLRVASGQPTHDLLAMTTPDMRVKLRNAIQRALAEKTRIDVSGGRLVRDGNAHLFSMDIHPVDSAGETLLLVCFIDTPSSAPKLRDADADAEPATPRLIELERELEATRAELQAAIHDLELSAEEQKAINEEALSVNEEYQSTNEELLTSKEELQSLNEELTALNSQLQETLERQRRTADDLRNVLFSTDVATLFLDPDLKIRFFTPATRGLFAVIPGDVGRPLADLHSLAADAELTADAQAVLRSHGPIEREISAQNGVWFRRRIMPYRAHDERIEGVVITFTDITGGKMVAHALEDAKQQAEQASLAKSRFLAAASHDLRQPLQTLSLLHGLLARTVVGERESGLLARLDDTLGAMAGMLNAVLDINQIEARIVQPELIEFPVGDLLGRLRDEFTYLAQAKGLVLRTVACSARIVSDPRLLEQIIRNLLSNALKYTVSGKVLFGCRRRAGGISIEIWDTGIGIAAAELQAIFEEYHQIGNVARERQLGLGLGLSIVQRLTRLLDHRVRVQSRPGKGSVFAIEVAASSVRLAAGPAEAEPVAASVGSAIASRHAGTVLVVEDDPELRDLLELFLRDEGYRTMLAPDGPTALQMVAHVGLRPDLVLADYNLPNAMNGLQFAERFRTQVSRVVPMVILTGDISTETLREVTQKDCVLLNKPVKLEELARTIGRLLPVPQAPPLAADDNSLPIVYVVDDDAEIRAAIASLIAAEGGSVQGFASGEAFLAAYRPGQHDCVLIDAYLPGLNGIEILRRLRAAGHLLPAIMITGSSDVAIAVQAMKAGAADFIEKPVASDELLAAIHRALDQSQDTGMVEARRAAAIARLAGLTPRQHEVMHRVLAGHPSKNIAADLNISQRTVENHRASIMKRTGSASLPALARLVLTASGTSADAPDP
jgi:two-component system CheB/CheR fusion protein